jgi:hypothetical protein
MEYAVDLGPGVMIYIPSFIKNGSAIQNVMGGEIQRNTYTHRQHEDRISLRSFLQNKESRLKTVSYMTDLSICIAVHKG